MTAILIDDMPQAVQLLQNDLQTHCPEIQIIGTAHSTVSAAKLLRQTNPDVIFLDILLGDGTGFDLLEILPTLTSKIIFITATEEYALKAFRIAAIDYLLKPFSIQDLKDAVQKAKKQLHHHNPSLDLLKETIRYPDRLPDRISLHTMEKIVVAEISQIIRCEADANNTRIYFHQDPPLYVTRTLKQFEDILKEHPFLRVHQSHLVNLKYIQEFLKRDGGFLKMKNNDLIPVSTRKKAEVMQWLEHL